MKSGNTSNNGSKSTGTTDKLRIRATGRIERVEGTLIDVLDGPGDTFICVVQNSAGEPEFVSVTTAQVEEIVARAAV